MIALFAITAVLVVMFYAQVVPLPTEASQMEHGVTEVILDWAYALFIVCALAAIVFPVIEFVKQLIEKPKSAMTTIIMIVAVIVVIFIAYAISSDSIDSITETLVETNATELKWSDCGLYTLYISLGISILAVIYAEVAKKFN